MARSFSLISLPAFLLVGAWAPASPDAVRHALAVFAEAPLGSESEAALAIIVDFAETSDAVEIVVSADVVPWLAGPDEVAHSELLLGAFVAGNLRSQLDSGVKRSDAYSGMLQVFAVYGALKAREPRYTIPSLEDYLGRHRHGELGTLLLRPADASSTEPPKSERPSGFVPPGGMVPDAATAIRIAVAIWEPIYGADQIAEEKPFVATLEGDVWAVTGSLPKGTSMKGGVAEARVARRDGRILHVSHGK